MCEPEHIKDLSSLTFPQYFLPECECESALACVLPHPVLLHNAQHCFSDLHYNMRHGPP